MAITRDEAWALLTEWTKGESLRRRARDARRGATLWRRGCRRRALGHRGHVARRRLRGVARGAYASDRRLAARARLECARARDQRALHQVERALRERARSRPARV